ncbi:hypothetical protein Hanom_Chr12g01070371 [Helianthus anomalus]
MQNQNILNFSKKTASKIRHQCTIPLNQSHFPSFTFSLISFLTTRTNNKPATDNDNISIKNTLFHPRVDIYPAKSGPNAAPTEPVPSMIALTVAKARELPLIELCVPRSAATAVVISAYGPFTSNPERNIKKMLLNIEMLPYKR